MQAFVQDGIFWHLLTFCAGVGGSLLIIGSAAGVVAMGLEKIEFGWYLRKSRCWHWPGISAGIAGYFPRTFAAGLKSITTKKGLSNKSDSNHFHPLSECTLTGVTFNFTDLLDNL